MWGILNMSVLICSSIENFSIIGVQYWALYTLNTLSATDNLGPENEVGGIHAVCPGLFNLLQNQVSLQRTCRLLRQNKSAVCPRRFFALHRRIFLVNWSAADPSPKWTPHSGEQWWTQASHLQYLSLMNKNPYFIRTETGLIKQ